MDFNAGVFVFSLTMTLSTAVAM